MTDAAAPQRRWRAACPNCGAPVEFASPASHSAVCSFCRSTLLRKDEELLRTGESAELFSDYSPLQIGTQGRWQGEPFTVLGRVQLAYEGGSWNEWHAFFDHSAKSAWLSEDNGRFVLSWPQGDGPRPPSSALHLDSQQIIEGRAWRVAALTPSTLHAAEGELPEPPKLGQAILVAELRNAQDEVGSLEYLDGTTAPRWSVGRAVDLAALQLANTREASVAGVGGRSLECPNCGSPIQPQLGQSLSVTCGQCRAVVQLGPTGQAITHHLQQMGGGDPPLALGRTGSLALQRGGPKVAWQIVGFLEREAHEDGETYPWREYLLFNRQQGFAFLVDSSEGWSVVSVLTGSPQVIGASLRWQGQTFHLKERYTATTTRVLGEFYWRVKRHEQGAVADYEGPNHQIMSREESGKEVTWSLGRRLDAVEVQAAFGMSSAMRRSSGDVGPLSGTGDAIKGIGVFLFIAVVLVVLMRACSDEPCDTVKRGFGAQSREYQQCLTDQGGSATPARCEPERAQFGPESSQYQQCLAAERSRGSTYRFPSGSYGGFGSGSGGGFGGGGHK